MSQRQGFLTGFSLIELLVVLTISFLVTGISLVVYRDYYRRKIVKLSAENWAKEVELLIKRTQSGAVVSDFAVNCAGIFEGLKVTVNADLPDYNLAMRCSDNVGVDNYSQVNKTYKINQLDVNKSVVFESDVSFEILPLSLGIKTVNDIDVGFCLLLQSTKTCPYKVVINKQGDVDVVKK